jgi:cholesterol oxidase
VSAPDRADVVIVGSGFGGAVAAARLGGQAGSVIVLERGRDWQGASPKRPRDFVFSSRLPHVLNGWLDVRMLDQMIVATGAGVGGGSLVYANVCVDAPREVFCTGWPSQITAEVMSPYYQRVSTVLEPQTIPTGQHNPRMVMLQKAAVEMNVPARFRSLPLAVRFDAHAPAADGKPWRDPGSYRQGTCVHCGGCIFGCAHDAKNTLDKNYLCQAKDAGAEVVPLSMVTHVEPGPAGSWRVHYFDLNHARRRRQVLAKIVILAAGSIGSTEILLRSRDEFETLRDLPRALGKGWSPNGDFLTLARYRADGPLEPTKGPTIGAVIDFLDGVDLPDDNACGVDGRIYIEDGGLPNIGAHLLADWAERGGWKGRAYQRASNLTAFSDMVPWFGQAIDGADGEFSLRSRARFWRARTRLNWNPQRSIGALDAFNDIHVAMTLATKGEPLPLASWKRLRMLVTPHPLGGCNMAAAPGAGVTRHNGEVFGHHNLFVMDGAVIPRAIGRNPSKTIAALAERNCELLGAELPARLAAPVSAAQRTGSPAAR